MGSPGCAHLPGSDRHPELQTPTHSGAGLYVTSRHPGRQPGLVEFALQEELHPTCLQESEALPSSLEGKQNTSSRQSRQPSLELWVSQSCKALTALTSKPHAPAFQNPDQYQPCNPSCRNKPLRPRSLEHLIKLEVLQLARSIFLDVEDLVAYQAFHRFGLGLGKRCTSLGSGLFTHRLCTPDPPPPGKKETHQLTLPIDRVSVVQCLL